MNTKDPLTVPIATFQHPSRHVTKPPISVSLTVHQPNNLTPTVGTRKKFLAVAWTEEQRVRA